MVGSTSIQKSILIVPDTGGEVNCRVKQNLLQNRRECTIISKAHLHFNV